MEVVVLGLTPTALGTLRCLRASKIHKLRISIIGPDAPEKVAWYSNIPHQKLLYKEQTLTECLIKHKNIFSSPPALLLTQDDQVVELSQNREKLKDFYRFLLPQPQLVQTLMEKSAFTDLALQKGWPIPDTLTVHSANELTKEAQKLQYPIIVKPYLTHAIRINDTNQLKNLAQELNDSQYTSCIIQEFVPGYDDNLFFCFLLFDINSNVKAKFLAQKLRQWPISNGTTSLTQTVTNNDLIDRSIRIFKEMGYQGFCSIEYKYNPNTEEYYIMEPTVGRFNQQVALTMASGVNFPEIMSKMLLGKSIEKCQQKNGIYWIFETNDWFSFIKEKNRKYGYFRNYLRKHVRVLFSFTDPLPFIIELTYLFKKKLKKLRKHV